MRALTLKREWAWLVAAGHKRIENRSWTTPYRGPLMIHAGKASDPAAAALCERLGIALPKVLPRSELICVVDLVDIIELSGLDGPRDDPFAVGPWCWILENVRLLESPIACGGLLGLWTPPAEFQTAALRPAAPGPRSGNLL